MERMDAIIVRPYAFTVGLIVFHHRKMPPPPGKGKKTIKRPVYCQIIDFPDGATAEVSYADGARAVVPLLELTWLHSVGLRWDKVLRRSVNDWPPVPELFQAELEAQEAGLKVGDRVTFHLGRFRALTGDHTAERVGYVLARYEGYYLVGTQVTNRDAERSTDPAIIRASPDEVRLSTEPLPVVWGLDD